MADTVGTVYKTSRLSYVSNYILVVLVLVFTLLLYPYIGTGRFFYLIYIPPIVAFVMFLEPESERAIRQYIVKDDEIVKIDGLITKKRISIPYRSIADTRVVKNIIGRMFKIGDIEINGYKDKIKMKGMKRPDEICKIIEEKIKMLRTMPKNAEE
jgi:membrane protein YdbS with pleckstrin-like domain